MSQHDAPLSSGTILSHQRARALLAYHVPEVPAELGARVVEAAAPLLARHARVVGGRVVWPLVLRAVAAALVPLPFLVFLDLQLVRTVHLALRSILPDLVSVLLVSGYAVGLLCLLASGYAAIPLLVERQRLAGEANYA